MTQPVGPESLAGAPPVPGASAVGGSAAGIASLTYRGVGLSYPAVASWLEAQEAITDSDDPYVTNTVDVKVGENEVVDFATTATINDGAYSHRFDTPQGIATMTRTAKVDCRNSRACDRDRRSPAGCC